MRARHKNKTFATLLAFLFGAVGAHRFYLRGRNDVWAWLHFTALPASLLALQFYRDWNWFFIASPLIVSMLAGCIEALVLGLTADGQWDASHNPGDITPSNSGAPLALLLVLTLGFGATALIASIARLFDLLLTGGAYG